MIPGVHPLTIPSRSKLPDHWLAVQATLRVAVRTWHETHLSTRQPLDGSEAVRLVLPGRLPGFLLSGKVILYPLEGTPQYNTLLQMERGVRRERKQRLFEGIQRVSLARSNQAQQRSFQRVCRVLLDNELQGCSRRVPIFQLCLD